jgi:hypothetical protein
VIASKTLTAQRILRRVTVYHNDTLVGGDGRLFARRIALPTIDLDVLHFALVLALTVEFGSFKLHWSGVLPYIQHTMTAYYNRDGIDLKT